MKTPSKSSIIFFIALGLVLDLTIGNVHAAPQKKQQAQQIESVPGNMEAAPSNQADNHYKPGIIKIKGKNADGYPIYDIVGGLDDVNYHDSYSHIFQPGDLVGLVKFASPKAVREHKIVCGWVCKDKAGNVVGIDPVIAKDPYWHAPAVKDY
jgi:hypothetical protein